jgi:hypothetical protein
MIVNSSGQIAPISVHDHGPGPAAPALFLCTERGGVRAVVIVRVVRWRGVGQPRRVMVALIVAAVLPGLRGGAF